MSSKTACSSDLNAMRKMIFPGMDPYLENPSLWPGIHNRFIVYLADHMQPLLGERYIAAVEGRVYVEGSSRQMIPDVWVRESGSPPSSRPTAVLAAPDAPVIVRAHSIEINEAYLTILDRNSHLEVVTVLELISPSNKHSGSGHTEYLAKQHEVLQSQSHLVEIDLLRLSRHVAAVPEYLCQTQGSYDYLISVNRAQEVRDTFELYFCQLRKQLPRIGIPLSSGDPDLILDLQAVLDKTYETGDYRRIVNYGRPCIPPLSPEDQAWANQLIAEAKAKTET
jgi:hypothetical protein